jgi:uncharacterized protein (DUF58 family)
VTAAAGALRLNIRRQAREWIRRRQGWDPRSVQVHTKRIYILPTRPGIIFAVILFAMLLGAMNYNNNMGFALTFLLASIGIISIHHCHRNLADVFVHYIGAQPVFVGDEMRFQIVIENRSPRTRWQIRVDWDGRDQICDELGGESRSTISLGRETARRGPILAPRIQLSTRYPLGLFRAWAWIEMNLSEIVYPAPAQQADGELAGDSGRRISGADRDGDDDFSGLRNYRPGDPPKHIAWKAFARTGETLVKEYHGDSQEPVWIDWNDCREKDTEKRISWLTRRVLDTAHANRKYGLRLPGVEVPPGQGSIHRHQCLSRLALHALPDDQQEATA